MNYCAGTNKGEIEQGHVFNNTWKLGEMTPERINYTSEKVTEAYTSLSATTDYTLAWGPAEGKVKAYLSGAWTEISDSLLIKNAAGKVTGIVKTAFEDNTRIAYSYNNVEIPQNDVPVLNVKMDNINLLAHARRLRVYYSQLAAYQA